MNEADRALAWFLAATDGPASWQRADRALALHTLEGHAPAYFRERGLAAAFAEALRALDHVPTLFTLDVEPIEALARLDALYLRIKHGETVRIHPSFSHWCRHFAASQPLFVWLMVELAAQLGLDRVVTYPMRPLRGVADLYWLTHLFLLETHYARRPLHPEALRTEIAELVAAASSAEQLQHTDLAAELAICLQLAGQHHSDLHIRLITMLRMNQRDDGRVTNPFAEEGRREVHATAVSLIAFAGSDPRQ